jgi:Na+/H+ antiporter NhaC
MAINMARDDASSDRGLRDRVGGVKRRFRTALTSNTSVSRSHGVSAQFGMMIRGAVLLAVGVFVVGSIFSAIPDSNALPNATTEVENITGQAFELAPIVLLVIVAVLILSFVRDL